MTIFLRAPEYRPGGPDGRGWNRLNLSAHMGQPAGQCALQPRSYHHLSESCRDTRLAQWGNYGHCYSGGDCDDCPVFNAEPMVMGSFTDRVMVRIRQRWVGGEADWHAGRGRFVEELHPMDRPEEGWASFSYPTTWAKLRRFVGWRVGRQFRDEHSEGFWLHKLNPDRHDGRPSPCSHGFINPDHCGACRIR